MSDPAQQRRPVRPSTATRWIAAGVVALLALLYALLVPLPAWLERQDAASLGAPAGGAARRDSASAERQKAIGDDRTAIVQLLTGTVALLGFAAAWVNLRHTQQTAATTLAEARETRFTDSFSKAVEQLGDDATAVRIGGVYTLVRLLGLTTHERDVATIAEILAAFVRDRTDRNRAGDGQGLGEDVRAAVVALAGRPSAGPAVTLARTDLRRIVLPPLARFRNANLADAILVEADLTRADLAGADLTGADLTDATLARACLVHATLTDATLARANLSGADLAGARFDGADLRGADFTGAKLHGAKLRAARNVGQGVYDASQHDRHTEWPDSIEIARPPAA